MALRKVEKKTISPGNVSTRRSLRVSRIGRSAKMEPERMCRDPQKLAKFFHAAENGEVVEVKHWLEKEGVNPNEKREEWRDTALMVSAVKGYTRTVRLLLEYGADPNARDRNLMTPLMLAVRYGMRPKMIYALLDNGARVRARNMLLETALDEARWAPWLYEGHPETYQKLEQRWVEEGMFYKVGKFFSGKKAEA